MNQASYTAPRNSNNLWQRLAANRRASRRLLAAALAIVSIATFFLLIKEDAVAPAKEISIAVNLPASAESIPTTIEEAATVAPDETHDQQEAQSEETLKWTNQTVRSGDNLTTIFQRVLLGAADVHRLITASPLTKPLTAMKPGEELHFAFSESGALAQVKYIKSKLESYIYTAAPEEQDAAYTAEHVVREPEMITAFREATIEDSLFMAGERAQLPHNLIMEVANIFGWDVDFALDIRKGDRFAVLFEEKFLDGEKIGTGNVLAAEFTNQGRTFKAVRYVDGKGNANYYTPEGFSMRKAFLRAPLDFTRISSNFNLRRKHPIHKNIRAHRGVDYAAPRGTPIFAAGDGKVIASGYSKPNGNYVFIQHGQRYTTKYLHLTKRMVKTGQTVRQRQVVGTLGSTGYATGPHLHYEFLVNGVHQNPRTVSLPKSLPIDEKERSAFETATAALMNQLALQQSTQLAMLSGEDQQHTTQ